MNLNEYSIWFCMWLPAYGAWNFHHCINLNMLLSQNFIHLMIKKFSLTITLKYFHARLPRERGKGGADCHESESQNCYNNYQNPITIVSWMLALVSRPCSDFATLILYSDLTEQNTIGCFSDRINEWWVCINIITEDLLQKSGAETTKFY